jgi:hypothetical protein
MSNLPNNLRSETIEIRGLTFETRVLPVMAASKIYAKIQRLLPIWADSDGAAKELGTVAVAGMIGGLDEATMQQLIETFGKATTVTIDDRTLPLIDKKGEQKGLDEALAGDFAALQEWLGFCIQVNFETAIAKLKGAQKDNESAPKAEPKGQ